MKKVYLILALSLLITPVFGYVANAQGGYYVSQEEAQLEDARRDAQEEQAFREDLELESKVSAFEELEEKERAEADEANKQLLIYVAIGAIGLFVIFLISHSLQKPKARSNHKK